MSKKNVKEESQNLKSSPQFKRLIKLLRVKEGLKNLKTSEKSSKPLPDSKPENHEGGKE